MNIKNEKTNLLIKGILSLETPGECYAFFDDLCTAKEKIEMSNRMYGALLLREGKTYAEVAGETGLSTATISRISRCLKYGGGGYNTVLDRISGGRRE